MKIINISAQMFNGIKTWFAEHKKEVVFAAIIFLVSSLSFGLGYLANREFNHAPIIIEKCSRSADLR